MTRVWAIPSIPMIVTCAMISDRLNDVRKFLAIRPKTSTDTIRTMTGTMVGLPCSRCWTVWSGECRSRSSNEATSPAP